MGNWTDQGLWDGLIDGTKCPICQRGEPLRIISEGPNTWLTMPEEGPMQGYVCLVSKVHAVELHDLTQEQASGFMSDVRSVSAAVKKATNCVKTNYEVHGNILPHLHMHFFPRFKNDPFEGKKIDQSLIPQPIYGLGEYDKVKESVLDCLDWAAASV